MSMPLRAPRGICRRVRSFAALRASDHPPPVTRGWRRVSPSRLAVLACSGVLGSSSLRVRPEGATCRARTRQPRFHRAVCFLLFPASPFDLFVEFASLRLACLKLGLYEIIGPEGARPLCGLIDLARAGCASCPRGRASVCGAVRPSAGPCVPCAVAVSPMCCGRASVRGAVSPVCCGRASVRGALLSELSAFLWCGHFRPWVPRGLFEKACVWLLLWLEPAVTHSRLVGVVPRRGKGVACTLGLLVGLCPWA